MNTLIITFEKPPVYERAQKAFALRPGTIFTYGDTLYNPDMVLIAEDVWIHELVHAGQQEYSTEKGEIWWEKYFTDPEFRLTQEVEAYKAQYKHICEKIIHDRNKQIRVLWQIASLLASPLYGNIVSKSAAARLIRS